MAPVKSTQGGQIIIEAILIIIVLLSAVIGLSSQMRDNEMIARLVSGPWSHLSGMIQNGVWMPREQAVNFHPSHFIRVKSLKGEEAK